ncbi:MAG: hypothetical protein ABIO45_13540 [Burkholderiaceae bacterium]
MAIALATRACQKRMKAGCANSSAAAGLSKAHRSAVRIPTQAQESVRFGSHQFDLSLIEPQLPFEATMGKYFLGWILGVPAIVLVVLYFFFR